MAEYIERDAAREIIVELQKSICPVGRYGRGYVYGIERDMYDELEKILDDIDAIPTADVADVVHGRLIETGMDEIWCNWGDCTACGRYNIMESNYCNWCGAKLDGGADNG